MQQVAMIIATALVLTGYVHADYTQDYSNSPGNTYVDSSPNREGNNAGQWNQNPHHYGNWNRNSYQNQQGAYQAPANNSASPANYSQPQKNQNMQRGELAAAADPTAKTANPSVNEVWNNYGDNTIKTSDQVTNQADIKISRDITESLMKDNSLSTQSKAAIVKVNRGVVTLTGTVTSVDEAKKVEAVAGKVDGVKSVDNQLKSLNTVQQ